MEHVTQHSDPHYDQEASKLGMWLFIFTELLLFGGLFIVYYYLFASDVQEILRDKLLALGIPEVLPDFFLANPWIHGYNIIF